MQKLQLHILADVDFMTDLADFSFRHKLKKSKVLHKAIEALQWKKESETFSNKQYIKGRKPHFESETNLFFTITPDESVFLEHCAKVNGYFSKSDFVRDILSIYMTNVDKSGEQEYINQLESEKEEFYSEYRDLSEICSIRIKRFLYYIRSFSERTKDYYFQLKYLNIDIYGS